MERVAVNHLDLHLLSKYQTESMLVLIRQTALVLVAFLTKLCSGVA